jgi:2,3-bisphosphoglycerate-independent phosphoglycerate mutase
MSDLKLLKELSIENETKIIMLVIDGLGGLPGVDDQTELESAHTPNLDALASRAICGMIDPISPGITPGSGPAHLALFGYDPLRYEIGRGVLEALGIGFPLSEEDLAIRGNFCTVNEEGKVMDRRAGRIPTEKCAELCNLLRGFESKDVKTFVEPVKEYRFLLVFRGEELSAELTETDPQKVGVPPFPLKPLKPEAERTAEQINRWLSHAKEVLKHQIPANMVLLRGFSKVPPLPKIGEIYKLKAAAIATYPMYKGMANLVGMELLETGESFEEELEALRANWAHYDFFYIHVKRTDSAGEDGDFSRRVSTIEEIDELLPSILELEPDVIIVTGDHSTPAVLRSHSWHPVPVLLWSKYCRADKVEKFSERECNLGGLGRFKATDLMPLAMANALRLAKYGA